MNATHELWRAVFQIAIVAMVLGACAAQAQVLISSQAVPQTANFFRMQQKDFPPLPFNPFPKLPIYWLGENRYLIDDRSVDYVARREQMALERALRRLATTASESGPPTPGEGEEGGGESEGDPVPPPYDYPTNVLWIHLYDYDPTNALAYLTLHNTRSDYYYQLQSKLDLSDPKWTLRQVVQDVYGTNQVYFDPVPSNPQQKEFFRGVEGANKVSIGWNQHATEPYSPLSDLGQDGLFHVQREGPTDFALTVVYRICGSASNGDDYTPLTGTVTIATGQAFGYIDVIPIEDAPLVDFDETVTLELVLTNGYVVDTNSAQAMIMIIDNPLTNELFTIVADLNQPIGIDYHAPSNSLIVSHNYGTAGQPNFARIYTNGVVTNIVVTNWSGIVDLSDEVKLATVFTAGSFTNSAGFTNGDMFFSSGTGIGWLSANGSVSNLNWCILTNAVETNALPLRGGLYVDQTGVFSNQLIAVTSPESSSPGNKGVWRVDAQQSPVLIANIDTPHLEGVITLTNDIQKWGPWAGKIITGDEDAPPQGVIYTIDTNAVVAAYDTTALFADGIHPEDFDIITTNQSLYCVNYHDSGDSFILKLDARWLTNYVGDLLITQAGEATGVQPKLFIVSWDNATSCLNARRISLPDSIGGRFEHVTFAPIKLSTQ